MSALQNHETDAGPWIAWSCDARAQREGSEFWMRELQEGFPPLRAAAAPQAGKVVGGGGGGKAGWFGIGRRRRSEGGGSESMKREVSTKQKRWLTNVE